MILARVHVKLTPPLDLSEKQPYSKECGVRNLKFARNIIFATSKTLLNSMKQCWIVLNLVFFSLKNLNLLHIQYISPRFIYFISTSTYDEFQIRCKFQISYSTIYLFVVSELGLFCLQFNGCTIQLVNFPEWDRFHIFYALYSVLVEFIIGHSI